MAQKVVGLRKTTLRTTVVGFRQKTTMVDFTGISVVCFGWRKTMLGGPTSVVGSICGLQTKNESNELQRENDSGGIQTYEYSGGH